MYVTPQKTFVYGTFRWPGRGRLSVHSVLSGVPMKGAARRDTALEILREFSTTELVGKIYVFGLNNSWLPVQPGSIGGYLWYDHFEKQRTHTYFDMEGSGLWEVLHFRNESDETGLYVAVALRYFPRTYPWIEAQRRKET
jgi:hypothetical protein